MLYLVKYNSNYIYIYMYVILYLVKYNSNYIYI